MNLGYYDYRRRGALARIAELYNAIDAIDDLDDKVTGIYRTAPQEFPPTAEQQAMDAQYADAIADADQQRALFQVEIARLRAGVTW